GHELDIIGSHLCPLRGQRRICVRLRTSAVDQSISRPKSAAVPGFTIQTVESFESENVVRHCKPSLPFRDLIEGLGEFGSGLTSLRPPLFPRRFDLDKNRLIHFTILG